MRVDISFIIASLLAIDWPLDSVVQLISQPDLLNVNRFPVEARVSGFDFAKFGRG